MSHISNEESLKGLFYIVKGQYAKLSPVIYIEGEEKCVGGYDPDNENTSEWYRVIDNVTFHCICCGSDFDKCLVAIKNAILKFKTRKNYFRHVCEVTSEDYYEVHYLGHKPLTHDQRTKKAEGRCPRTSPAQKRLEQAVLDTYGDYYRDVIEEVEDEAYEEIKNDKPLMKSKKRFKRLTKPVVEETPETPVETPKKTKLTRKKTGLVKKKVRRL
jgi:hypothetical protein